MAMVQKLQQENQALDAFGKQAQQQLAQMQAEKDSKALELKVRMDITELQEKVKLEIAKMQDETKRLLEAHASAHEGAMSHVQHGRDRETAENEEETAGTQEEGQPLELAI
jgi:predicted GNAT superfamily acetyltransferase